MPSDLPRRRLLGPGLAHHPTYAKARGDQWPRRVKVAELDGWGVKAVSLGTYHSLALTDKGKHAALRHKDTMCVWAWEPQRASWAISFRCTLPPRC